jgi:hypothetical protein
MSYLPVPPRVWSRIENPCVFNTLSYENPLVFVPLTNQTVPLSIANMEEKIQYKGNILQYKKNNAGFNKNQRYSQLAKRCGPNRTTVYATQSETYSNPNTTGLKRINAQNLPYPNPVVGEPNNPAGPFAIVANPNDCSGNSVQDGGSLLCGTYANPCTNITTQIGTSRNCFPSYCSDVPGKPIELCWNPKIPTFYPRTRYIMPTSGTKWPQGYKAFVSALRIPTPILSLISSSDSITVLSWAPVASTCIPVTGYQIYQNGEIILSVPSSETTASLNVSQGNEYWITAVSQNIESARSNIIVN